MIRVFLVFSLMAASADAALTWRSSAVNQDIAMAVLETRVDSAAPPLIVYLENLAAPRSGTESDEAILNDFKAEGFLVVTLDYAHRPEARWPMLNRDLAALREQIQKKGFLEGRAVDTKHIFIVPSGHRLKRDVVFYREPNRTLAFDLIYPSHPNRSVGTVLEFSCDNKDRMGNFSLNFCTDTLLEGAATEGFAVAMADHPVPTPYAGIDPMPECIWKTKAAVRTLRSEVTALGMSDRIVPVGFSRGSGMALLLVTTQHIASAATPSDSIFSATTIGQTDHSKNEAAEVDGNPHGEHLKVDSAVQGAVVLSGRFTYLDLLPDDKMIPRYNALWGDREHHEGFWRAQGALDYLTAPTEPLFLSINCTESPDALHQMEVFRRRLTELHSPFEYHLDEQPRGHRVPLTPEVLDPMLAYLKKRLGDPKHP